MTTSSVGVVAFTEIAANVYVARVQPLDVNVTLVTGDDAALVIDTLSTRAQAETLLAAIREITTMPLTIVNTHFHFDHCFGNDVLAAGGRPVFAHPSTVRELAERGSHWQRAWYDEFAGTDAGLADAVAAVTIHVPDRAIADEMEFDLGGTAVRVTYPGHGHTAGDLIAVITSGDETVVAVGDLVEEGAPPCFPESYPLDWPAALDHVLHAVVPGAIVVPGHGGLVDRAYVETQQADLAAFAWLIRDGHRDGATVETVAGKAPWPADVCRAGVERGFAALDACTS